MKDKIIYAIKNRHLLEFTYKSHFRIVEPHTFGIFSNGNEILVSYQIGGTSETGDIPDWRPFTFSKIENLKVLNENFMVARSGYKRADPRFREIYCDL